MQNTAQRKVIFLPSLFRRRYKRYKLSILIELEESKPFRRVKIYETPQTIGIDSNYTFDVLADQICAPDTNQYVNYNAGPRDTAEHLPIYSYTSKSYAGNENISIIFYVIEFSAIN